MTKSTKMILTVTMAVALTLVAFLIFGLARDRREVRLMTAQLAESRDAWETTAAEKENLQAELQAVQNDIREAQLTLEESTTRAEQLKADIAELEAEIETLETQK